jgi:hypothetical protein
MTAIPIGKPGRDFYVTFFDYLHQIYLEACYTFNL